MMRRSFRFGLRVGLLGGIVAAVAKTIQARRSNGSGGVDASPAEWPSMAAPPKPDEPVSMATAPAVAAPDEAPSAATEPEVPQLRAEEDRAPAVRKSPAKKASGPAKKAAGGTKKAARPAAKAGGKKAATPAAAAAWVEPTGSVCPPSHPVKAKLSSKLFHLPGMFAYARTTPDRCYRSEEDAAADGLTKAKR